MESKIYDVVIIGSGLGGLISGLLLAMEGKSVCILEKNNQYGGNLQTFVRDKTIFDTGVHYIGGLEEGQNLNKIFSYLGIRSDLKLEKMDPNGFDQIYIDADQTFYPLAQGYDNFVAQLLPFFPDQEEALKTYITDIQDVCERIPAYTLNKPSPHDEALIQINAKSYFENLTSNLSLRAVLAGQNFLYAGTEETPFYVHALCVNSYIQSAYRCLGGGSQISKLLIKQLRAHGVDLFKHKEVVALPMEAGKIEAAVTKCGAVYKGNTFISNIDPKITLQHIGSDNFRKTYYNRIQNIPLTTSSFCVFITLKEGCIPYKNHNIYHFSDHCQLFNTSSSSNQFQLISMSSKDKMAAFADGISVLTYMSFDEVKIWENSFNTVHTPQDRPERYEVFKKQKTEEILLTLEKHIPNIRSAIKGIYSASPLSYRDYIGNVAGSLYGPCLSSSAPLQHYIGPTSKISNLYFTGQHVNMHGILGVSIGALLTCSVLLNHTDIFDRIRNH